MESHLTDCAETVPKAQSSLDKFVTAVIALVFASLIMLAFSTTRARSREGAADMEEKQAAAQMVLELARTVVRFGNARGKLPKDFKELVPDFLPQVPLDPYGRKYKLIRNGDNQAYVYYYGKDGLVKGYVERDRDVAAVIRREGNQFVTN